MAIKPFEKSLPDWEIICRLTERMGYPMGYTSVEDIMKEVSSLVPIYRGISQEGLKKGGIFWPPIERGSDGEGRISVQGWKVGKVTLLPARLKVQEMEEEGLPFILMRGSVLYHFLSGTRSMRSVRLKAMKAGGFVEMNPSDALELGLKEGDLLRVFNERGDVSMTLKLSESISKGMVFCPSFDQSSSRLFSLDTKGINTTRVNIQKENGHERGGTRSKEGGDRRDPQGL